MISSSSSEDDDHIYDILKPIQRGPKKTRPENYAEITIPRYSGPDFKSHFRLHRHTFEAVLESIADVLESQNKGRKSIAPDKQFLIALWIFGTPDSYRSVADRFDVGRNTALRCVRRVTDALCTLSMTYIVWPTGHQVAGVVQDFQASQGFPGVVSAIDGSHIPILGPREDKEAYRNRHDRLSINLQACCDSDMKFTHCYAGEVGSVHDARVFRKSEVHDFATRRSATYFPQHTHIIGDLAYPCLPTLLTPCKDNGHLTRRQKNFNFRHSSTRMSFRTLKRKIQKVARIGNAAAGPHPKVHYCMLCCILHNICILQDDDHFDVPNEPARPEDNAVEDTVACAAKRNAICAQLRM
ncbi:hypothetical protein B566_EDAN012619 [Ephemera danica]|nr:hypothetical protein B566_EDAN012619 [Ephemera danica]